jgi:hypothetical protein
MAGTRAHQAARTSPSLSDAADKYVRLVHAFEVRDPQSRESDFGGGSRTSGALHVGREPLTDLAARADRLADELSTIRDRSIDATRRRLSLIKQSEALATRAEQLDGRRFAFDDELQRLFGRHILPPAHDRHETVHREIERLVPGGGILADRLAAYESRFLVPPERLPAVFERALAGCRAQTLTQVAMPPGESVIVEYVDRAPWSGHSRYLGDFRSVVRVNTQFGLSVDRVLDLACHEGYPGHHTYNVLREQRMVRQRGWREFSVLPLYTPQAFSAEVAASRSGTIAFADAERVVFERDVLFPLAGLDPAEAEGYVTVMRLLLRLDRAIAGTVRRYLSGELDYARAVLALQDDALMAHPEATLKFVNQFRGYSLAYVIGTTTGVEALDGAATRERLWRDVVESVERF